MKDFRADRAGARPAEPAPALSDDWAGPELRGTLAFLLVPIVLGVLLEILRIGMPSWGLKVFALLYGFTLFVRTTRDPEWLLAILIIYLPLNRLYPASIAPAVNATNVLVGLLAMALILRAARHERLPAQRMPFTGLVKAWLVLSTLSIAHGTMILGFGALVDGIGLVRVWMDQFLVFFGFLYLIRDGRMARRMVVYMMIGTLVVLALGFDEWLEKRDYSTIERARLLGPQLQPNDFAAFLVMGISPFMAVIVTSLRKWWVLGFAPVMLAFVRVLLATFSRGAYIGFGIACVLVSYVRGKVFLTLIIAGVVGVFSVMPEIVPDALRDRLEQSTGNSFDGPELDTSSQTRLVLWHAAIDMTLESPVFGKGFGMFPLLKERYTAHDVPESDNHNMYLYICSQMGIPALLVFLAIFLRAYLTGANLFRRGEERSIRIVGLTAVAMVGGTLGLNMFGSRMVDVAVMMHFWVLLAVISHLQVEESARLGVVAPDRRAPIDPRAAPVLQRTAAGAAVPAAGAGMLKREA